MKINRDRAWRRKKTRLVVSKIRDTKNWLLSHFSSQEVEGKPPEKAKRHRPGKLTRAQDLRQNRGLDQELAEGF